jgi:hypothetical protein
MHKVQSSIPSTTKNNSNNNNFLVNKGQVVNSRNPNTWEAEQEDLDLEVSLVYR